MKRFKGQRFIWPGFQFCWVCFSFSKLDPIKDRWRRLETCSCTIILLHFITTVLVSDNREIFTRHNCFGGKCRGSFFDAITLFSAFLFQFLGNKREEKAPVILHQFAAALFSFVLFCLLNSLLATNPSKPNTDKHRKALNPFFRHMSLNKLEKKILCIEGRKTVSNCSLFTFLCYSNHFTTCPMFQAVEPYLF